MKDSVWSRFLKLFLPLILIALIYIGFFLFDISCPIKFLTGLSCAGCGMTRALFNGLFGNFTDAFYYHPLWPIILPLAVALLCLYLSGDKKRLWSVLWFTVALFLITYVVRFFTTPEIVGFDFEKTIFYQFTK